MAVVRVIDDGPRNFVVGITGVVAETTTITAATLSASGGNDGKQAPNDLSFLRGWYGGIGIDLTLLWQTGGSELFWVFSAGGSFKADFRDVSGIPNQAPGKTGNVLVTTIGAGTFYSTVLHFHKKYP